MVFAQDIGQNNGEGCLSTAYALKYILNKAWEYTTGRILAFPVSGNVPETVMKCHMFFTWLSNFLFKNWCNSFQIFLWSFTAVQGGISYRISFRHCVPAKWCFRQILLITGWGIISMKPYYFNSGEFTIYINNVVLKIMFHCRIWL